MINKKSQDNISNKIPQDEIKPCNKLINKKLEDMNKFNEIIAKKLQDNNNTSNKLIKKNK